MVNKSSDKIKTYKDLNRIKKDIFQKALYVYGKDAYIANVLVDGIAGSILNTDLIELNTKTINGQKVKTDEIINEINLLPVFDKYKLIIIKNSTMFEKGLKPIDTGFKELINILEKKPDYALIVFISYKKPHFQNVLFKHFQKNDAAYQLNGCDIEDNFIKKWLLKISNDLNLIVDKNSIDFFLSYIGYYDESANVNAEILYSELLKLSSYCADKKTVEITDIKNICISYMPEGIEDLINALNTKDLKKAVIIMNQLIKNTYPTFILNSIIENFNIMLLDKQYLSNAWDFYNKLKTIKSIKYFNYNKVKSIKKCSSNFSEKKIKSIIFTCAKYDNGVKTGIIDAKIGLERIIYFICT